MEDLLKIPYQDELVRPLSSLFVAACIVLLGIAIFTMTSTANSLRKRGATWLVWASLLALALFGFRALGVPMLGWRIWEYGSWLVVLAAVANCLAASYQKQRTLTSGDTAPVRVFCTQCGKPNAADARFCRSCGKPLQTSTLTEGP